MTPTALHLSEPPNNPARMPPAAPSAAAVPSVLAAEFALESPPIGS
jgi:hypothetical protein